MIFEKIAYIISDWFDLNENDISRDSLLRDDLGIDSLGLIDLVMSIEDEFGLELPDEALAEMKTVGDIIKFIEEK